VIVTDMDRTDDGVMLERLQRAAFGYFLEAVNPANGLVADTSRERKSATLRRCSRILLRATASQAKDSVR
jgi:hypothetical protein